MHEVMTVSVPEAGRILGIGRTTAFRLAGTTIPVLRLGKKLRVPIPALNRMLDSAERQTEENAK